MASGRFFYDDCRSATRLAREYYASEASIAIALGGTEPTLGKPYYRITKQMAGNQFSWVYLVSKLFKNFEMQFIERNNKAAPNENSFSIFKSIDRSATGSGCGIAEVSNGSYWLKGGFNYYGAIVAGPAFSVNTWYNIKYRDDGTNWKFKRWAYGTSEPNWTFTQASVNKANEMEQGNFNNNGFIGLGTYTDNTQIILIDIADIRITPIRRTGP